MTPIRNENSNIESTLAISDEGKDFLDSASHNLYWNGSGDPSKNTLSILDLVQINSKILRDEYLTYVYKASNLNINGNTASEILKIDGDFSFWSMTLIEEKCNSVKSKAINQAIKFLQLEKNIKEWKISKIILNCTDNFLYDCLVIYCKENNIELVAKVKRKSISNVCLMLYEFFKSIYWFLKFLLTHISLINVSKKILTSNKKQATIVSYLDNIDLVNPLDFKSGYWGHLPELLKDFDYKINWIHFYIKDEFFPSSKAAKNYLEKLNQSESENASHFAIESFASFRVWIITIVKWISLFIPALRIIHAINASNFSITIKILFKKDLIRSIFGSAAIYNLVHYYSFKNILEKLQVQNLGLYLHEGQSWERGFLNAWKFAGHGFIVGVPHSNIRFWDLRFFCSTKELQKSREDNLLPDILAVNGRASYDVLSENGIKVARIELVEALRYLHLNKFLFEKLPVKEYIDGKLNILILGDFLLDKSLRMITMLSECIKEFPSTHFDVLYKPHPNCSNISSPHLGLSFEASRENISKIINASDIVLASSDTTAAIEAYLYAKPIICVTDNNIMNMSPLVGKSGVYFVGVIEEMISVARDLLSGSASSLGDRDPTEFFCLGADLKRWEKILKLNQC